MPYILEDLVVDRVDLVTEGANSAAFIEVFKRKEQRNPMEVNEILSKLKPEHADVIKQKLDAGTTELATVSERVAKLAADLDTVTAERDTATAALSESTSKLAKATEDLEKANAEIATLKAAECTCDGESDEKGNCSVCGKPKKKRVGFDETEVLKGMPEHIREAFIKMRAQKEAAEAEVRKAADEKATAEAVAKAATLKALPVEQSVLVDILKKNDQSVIDVLTAAATAIDTAVLGEVGGVGKSAGDKDAWTKIEAEADKVMQRDSVSKQKAIATVIKEQPDLYKEYLNGGAN